MSVSIHQDPMRGDRLDLVIEETGTPLGYISLYVKGMEHKQELIDQLSQRPIVEKSSHYVLKDIAELTGALESLVNKYVANQGTPGEFVICITPEGIPWYWVRAKQALELGCRRLKQSTSP